MEQLPEGKLRIQHNSKSSSYYQAVENRRDNGTLIKDKHLIHQLAQKNYIKAVLKAAEAEKKDSASLTKGKASATVTLTI